MAMLNSVYEDEYRPEYGTLIVRDATWDEVPVAVSTLLDYFGTKVITGTIGRSGKGWIDGRASDEYHAVRLEAHDGEPDDDIDAWADVVDLPLLSAGSVGLATMTGRGVTDPLPLGPPGVFRVRYARRSADEGDEFRLQFWSSPWPAEPPVWRRRARAWLDASVGDRPDHQASDVMTLALWAAESGSALTVTYLAERLRATVEQVQAILAYAVERDFVQVAGDPSDPATELAIVVQPRHSPPPRPRLPDLMALGPPGSSGRSSRRPSGRSGGSGLLDARIRERLSRPGDLPVARQPSRPAADELPVGAPPRAGVVSTDGDLVIWRDGTPVQLASWRASTPRGGDVWWALESAYGTVLSRSSETVLVRPDGAIEPLGSHFDRIALADRGGRQLAASENVLGRRPRSAVHLIDLADGSRQSLEWAEPDQFPSVVAGYDGVIFVRAIRLQRTFAWRPGADPLELPYQLWHLDPYSGVALATDRGRHFMLVGPDGRLDELPPTAPPSVTYLLAPGATHLVTFTQRPESVRLTPVHPDAGPERVVDLPPRSRVGDGPPNATVWEDADHLLVPVDGPTLHCVRLDIRSGELERVAVDGAAFHRPVLVRPRPDLA